ncbi:MAG: hypothetical protein JJ896_01110 [Rhodothermales bacterium]|nr:hypothetical protein [Rhodothermales bacterium]MBO6778227.1 hypothetical protein [Rhodothermales bacterium]
MRKLILTVALIAGAFTLPGMIGTVLGIAGGFAAASYLFTAPRTKKLLKWGADKYVADEKRREKARDWIHTES